MSHTQHRSVYPLITDLRDDELQFHLTLKNDLYLYLKPKQKQIKQYLGASIKNHIILDLREGVDLDEFCAIIGSLCGGFCLFLILPLSCDRWMALDEELLLDPSQRDQITHNCLQRLILQFKRYFGYQMIESMADLSRAIDQGSQDHQIIAQEHQPKILIHEIPQSIKCLALELKEISGICANQEQFDVMLELMVALISDQKAYLTLLSQRGRGKSSTLGLAIGLLLYHGKQRFYLCAHLFEHVQEILIYAQKVLKLLHVEIEEGKEREQRFIAIDVPSKNSQLYFIYPSFLSIIKPSKLIFDECAGISMHVLQQSLSYASQIVFSTTIQGYEGNARNFALKFLPQLNKNKSFKHLHLHHPIRWAKNDPLEAFVDDVLWINAMVDLDRDEKNKIDHEQLKYEVLDRHQLAQDEVRLKACFQILLKAHYQTTVNDLWRMLDAPNLSIHIVRDDQRILGAMLVTMEGNLSNDALLSLYLDHSRPRGQLIPTNLAVHLHQPKLAQKKICRMMRIAVLKQLQHLGLGCFLIENLYRYAYQQGIDFIGASFSATAPLISFWHKNHFRAVRLSLRANRNSGDYSILMLRSCRFQLESQVPALYQPLDFLYQLRSTEHCLDIQLIKNYLRAIESNHCLNTISHFQEDDWQKLMVVAYIGRSYEIAFQQSYLLCLQYFLDQKDFLDQEEESMILHKIIQGLTRDTIINEQAIQSPTLMVKKINQAIRLLFEFYAPAQCQEMAQGLMKAKKDQG